MKNEITNIIKDSIAVKESIIKNNIDEIVKIAEIAIDCLKNGNKIILFGNGGSAADSQHIAAELVGRFQKERGGLAAIALTTNSSIITAIGNDYGFDEIFSRQIEAIAKKGDLVIGISTSGKAKNVIAGINKAKEMGIKTVGLTGVDGGLLAKTADVSLIVSSKVTARIQETHITIGHIICELVEKQI
ncbi:MAG: D-sedoheptulose 7-phosphate isomerase [Candidatus Omnitrophica bacterium]|nr:D-sedoheptulose 7-phosphate isomerase [Candidatus Omnitrophota bacterium]HOX55247.1 D-sedoheptulose 7-phosphate isomerase [Candidatus Omnitrophota bacterium]